MWVLRGQNGYMWHKGAFGVPGGCWGVRAIGGITGVSECRGVRDAQGGKWTESLTTLGPSPKSWHCHWFPLGSDLPGQDQASAKNDFSRLFYTFRTIFHDSLHICIYATSSHTLTHNVKKCYTDYFHCRPIYASPYTINLMYYDTMVLITKNYFSHQTSKLGTSFCKCQADLM